MSERDDLAGKWLAAKELTLEEERSYAAAGHGPSQCMLDDAYAAADFALAALARRSDREGWQTLSECRDFLQDIVGGAQITERSIENAKALVAEADAHLSRHEQR